MMQPWPRLGQDMPAMNLQTPSEQASQAAANAWAQWQRTVQQYGTGAYTGTDEAAASQAVAEAWAQWQRTIDQYGTGAYTAARPAASLLSDPRVLGVLAFLGLLLILPGPGRR